MIETSATLQRERTLVDSVPKACLDVSYENDNKIKQFCTLKKIQQAQKEATATAATKTPRPHTQIA